MYPDSPFMPRKVHSEMESLRKRIRMALENIEQDPKLKKRQENPASYVSKTDIG
jgi:hypothetical protein